MNVNFFIGIESKLDHLIDLNVDAYWISPIYKSPMVDFGYDISDFCDIEPTFGTLEDFEHLVNVSHRQGLKVVMDYVPNHSSDLHEWFQKSLKNIQPYSDFYTWLPGKINADGSRSPPNNWVNDFLMFYNEIQ